MKFEQVKNWNDQKFSKKTGITWEIFNKMLNALSPIDKLKESKGRPPCKLSLENKILMTVKYWKKYYTFEDLAEIYEIDTSTCYRNIIWVEKNLVKHNVFALPKRTEFKETKEENPMVLIVDASESKIQRPKKNKKSIIQEKRSATQENFK